MHTYYHPQEGGTLELPSDEPGKDVDVLKIRGHQFQATDAQAAKLDALIVARKSRARRLDKHGKALTPEQHAAPAEPKPAPAKSRSKKASKSKGS